VLPQRPVGLRVAQALACEGATATPRRASTAIVLLVCLLTLALLASCGGKPKAIGPAPAEFKAILQTTKGPVAILVHRDWAPIGADRFYELVKIGYYNDNYFYRALKGFIVQWGINGDPKVAKDWSVLTIKDDPRKQDNLRGRVSFAKPEDKNGRSTLVFVNLADNKALDAEGFVPFGEVVDGMNVIDSLYMEYGDGPPTGAGPDAAAFQELGNDLIEHRFDKLDKIKKALIQ
jgi:peptidyl-prolyl cis-trans isomerase A (cyclophilin A)